jgi:hypothetical protein
MILKKKKIQPEVASRKQQAPSAKLQATSFKQQATSNPAGLQELDPTVDWNKLIDTLKTE